MFKRLTGVVALSLLLLLGVLAVPALAVEEGGEAPVEESGPAPGIDEIGTQNEVSGEFKPEPSEQPPFMRFLVVPLVAAGVVVLVALMLLYLVWQPRFASERRSKRRR